MAITRQRLENDIIRGLKHVDIDPSFNYSQPVAAPEVYLVKGDFVYFYGPDHFIWIADVETNDDGVPLFVDWANAGPLYRHLEYMHGEMFKLRLNDDQLFIQMAAIVPTVRELQAQVLIA